MMEISKNKRSFIENGKPIFYLADTCWSAFTNISEDDWVYYLNFRKQQGFNVIQVNMLWQWDSSETNLNYLPFKQDVNGNFNFSQLNGEYFDRAGRMIKAAYDKGITIAIVLLWSNYIPNTWASDMKVNQKGLFPKALLENYVSEVITRYDQYQPIYVISGDTDFQTQEVIDEYYGKALQLVKAYSPNAITTLHIRGRYMDIPERFVKDQGIDFYMYQSGHNPQYSEMGYYLAQHFYHHLPDKPIINSEPCYEMMGYSRREYGRFSREDVRKVAWQSVLSGANAGITYGAHGIWSWHNQAFTYDTSVGEAFEEPYDWHDALHFEGASDYGFIRFFFEKYALNDIHPAQDLFVSSSEKYGTKSTQEIKLSADKEIRIACNDQMIIAYIPSNIRIKIKGNYKNAETFFINLNNRTITNATKMYDEILDITVFNMYQFVGDALLVIKNLTK